ncbi:Polypyrimidine tract-binding protein 1 [Microtus ochrogaster]|uniref:Polypyrimidine tract-binding protein 1 n=1 Tax=Microtus ochrogaster TaxID=79684 RepID=A0A8J6G2H4_MICOH|nr:Polypyrimidine tract-binding protein 1 [Microtus ochrogaster]
MTMAKTRWLAQRDLLSQEWELLQHDDLSTDGQNTHKACCMLHSCFSKVTSLNLKGNDKNRHCTYPGLLSGDG